MSMQRIRNYGSSLQAYALKRVIEGLDSANKVSFLEYRPGSTFDGSEVVTASSRLGRAVAKLREYNDVEARLVDRLRFFNHKRSYDAKYFPMLGIDSDSHGEAVFDVQVIGSDEVFNCFQSNTNVGYSRDLFGYGARAPHLISYAASFGNTTLERIEAAGLIGEIASDLGGFAALSVRDQNSAEIVQAIHGTRPEVHVDPVLVYNFHEAEQRIPRRRVLDEPYVVVYGYSGRLDAAENAGIVRYARSIGARIVCLGGVQECGDRFVDCDPFQLLAYFRDAAAVVTDTFHGSIFSIINHVPFATIVRPTLGDVYGNEEKLGCLLELFGLESRRVSDPNDIDRALEDSIDADLVDSIIRRERSKALAYLAREIR